MRLQERVKDKARATDFIRDPAKRNTRPGCFPAAHLKQCLVPLQVDNDYGRFAAGDQLRSHRCDTERSLTGTTVTQQVQMLVVDFVVDENRVIAHLTCAPQEMVRLQL